MIINLSRLIFRVKQCIYFIFFYILLFGAQQVYNYQRFIESHCYGLCDNADHIERHDEMLTKGTSLETTINKSLNGNTNKQRKAVLLLI